MPIFQDRQYYVYILTNRSKTLYVGVTNNLEKRMYEHKAKLAPGFTNKYNLTPARLLRTDIGHRIRHSAGKADQRLAPSQKNRINRIVKPTMEGSVIRMAP